MDAMYAPEWAEDAACRFTDPDVFFKPEDGSRKDWEEPRKVCNGTDTSPACPVRDACLAWAIETRDGHAMLGGLTPAERQPLLPKLTAPPSMRLPINHGTEAGYQQHKRRREAPCTACKRAANVAKRVRDERRERSGSKESA